jgi:hypothetical protein
LKAPITVFNGILLINTSRNAESSNSENEKIFLHKKELTIYIKAKIIFIRGSSLCIGDLAG